jgi:MtN3 and saliva related transmembrane protein
LNWYEIFGLFGAVFINVAFVPQVWRLYRMKSAKEISLPFTILLICGGISWLTYGFLNQLPSVIIANIVAMVLNILMLTAKLIYGR